MAPDPVFLRHLKRFTWQHLREINSGYHRKILQNPGGLSESRDEKKSSGSPEVFSRIPAGKRGLVEKMYPEKFSEKNFSPF